LKKGTIVADKFHILGFAGSLRKESYNRSLLRAALELLPEPGPVPSQAEQRFFS
jgi:hypothetical protein